MNPPASDGVAHLELAAGVHTEPDDLIGQRVAHNLLRLRGKRNLAGRPGADFRRQPAMLAQIESGRSVPSIKVLCKIAQGLKVSVAAFLDDRAFAGVAVLPAQQSKRLVSATALHQPRAVPSMWRARWSSTNCACAASPGRRRGPRPRHPGEPGGGAGTEVRVNEERFLLATGDSILFFTPTSRTATAIPPIAKRWRTW